MSKRITWKELREKIDAEVKKAGRTDVQIHHINVAWPDKRFPATNIEITPDGLEVRA